MTKQALVLSITLLVLCVLSHTRLYQHNQHVSSESFRQFPQRIGQWQTVAEFPPSPKEVELLETNDIIARLYRDEKGREVHMALVYDASGNRKMAHPQEICLTAGGMNTVSKNSVPLGDSGMNVERLVVERDGNRQLYYYWYKAGPCQSGNYLETQLRLALYSLTGQQGGTALMRISGRITPESEEKQEQALRDFGLAAMPEMERHLP